MPAFQNHNVDTIDLTMDDEPDVVVVAPSHSTDGGRAARTRHSLGNTVSNPSKRKRVRTLSDSTIENHVAPANDKRQKMDDKKSVCLLAYQRDVA